MYRILFHVLISNLTSSKMSNMFILLQLCWLGPVVYALSHPRSPCPAVFTYSGSEPNQYHWYGNIEMVSDSILEDVTLDIQFDRPADLLVSWFGEVTTTNNENFTILSLSQRLMPDSPFNTRFLVKYDPNRGRPQLKTIHLNKKQICPHQKVAQVSPTPRPDPVFEDYKPSNFGYQSAHPETSYSSVHTDNSGKQHVYNSYNNHEVQEQHSSSSDGYYSHDREPLSNTGNIRTTERLIPYVNNNKNINTNKESGTYTASNKSTEKSNRATTVKPNPTHNTKKQSNINGNHYTSTSTTSRNIISSSSSNYSNNKHQSSKVTQNSYNKPKLTTSNPESDSNSNFFGGNYNNAHSDKVKRNFSQTDEHNYNQFNLDSFSTESGNSFTRRPTSTQKDEDFDLIEGINTADCGKIEEERPLALIVDGKNTYRGQWPWHVAIYKSATGSTEFICGGTLINEKAVITAAHCVTKVYDDTRSSATAVEPKSLAVFLGKYHLQDISEDVGVQTKQVGTIHVHPEYNRMTFFNDIALLILTRSIRPTKFVRPCCIWNDNVFHENVIGKDGTVIGWGLNENERLSGDLKMGRMPVVSRDTCISSYETFFSQYTSENTLCAGNRKGTSACNGDSGGGLFFSKNSTWYVRGLVSNTVARPDIRICDPQYYVVFTDISKYINWINTHVKYL